MSFTALKVKEYKMTEKMPIEKKKAITPPFRCAFPHVFEPHSGFENQEKKFSVTMLFDKNTDLNQPMKDGYVSLRQAVYNAAVEKWGPKEKWPKNLRFPFRDGNEKPDLQGYQGAIFCSASSKQKPQVVDQKLAPLVKEDDLFYGGCYARAEVVAFAYDQMGNKGVSLGLNNIQKLRDGDRFSGRKNASDVFDAVEDGSDDDKSYGQHAPGEVEDGMGF